MFGDISLMSGAHGGILDLGSTAWLGTEFRGERCMETQNSARRSLAYNPAKRSVLLQVSQLPHLSLDL